METSLLVNTILSKSLEKKQRLRPMKLQKLMFFTCGLYAAYYGKWLIDGDFLVYPYGPVEESTYNYFSKLGADHINEYISDGRIISSQVTDIYDTLDIVLKKYLLRSDFELSDITHEEGSPWFRTLNDKDKGGWRSKIERGRIMEYYKEQVKSREFPEGPGN